VVFSELSKLLNQEDALGAPCLPHFPDLHGPIADTAAQDFAQDIAPVG
jgi:hypothetical protein